MGYPNQTTGQISLTQEVTLVGLHGVDVPRIRWRRASHGMLESTLPFGSTHTILVNNEHLKSLVRVALCCNLTGENGNVILVLLEC